MVNFVLIGHGDTIVIADGNFPAKSTANANSALFIPAYGLGAAEILNAILTLLPLDKYDPKSAFQVMQVVPNDTNSVNHPEIWDVFSKVVSDHEGDWLKMEEVERFEFYERAKKAFAVVATSEAAIYANVILKKGVIQPGK